MLSSYTNAPNQQLPHQLDPEGSRRRRRFLRPPDPRPSAQDALLQLSGASHQAQTKVPTAELCEGECACTPDESSLSHNHGDMETRGGAVMSLPVGVSSSSSSVT